MERNLKDYREKELKMYVMGNILIILVGTGMIKDIALLMGEKIFGKQCQNYLNLQLYPQWFTYFPIHWIQYYRKS